MPKGYAQAMSRQQLAMLMAGSALARPGLGAPPRLMRFGFGDAAGDYNAFSNTVSAGDQYLAGGEYDSAVGSYQAAGNVGATTLGPEIDAQTGGASQSLTQQAWQLNGQLAAITSSGSSQSDATNAQNLAHQMQSLYSQAMSATPQTPSASALQSAAQSALSALQADSNYCGDVGTNGTAVNSAVHAFKVQWNASGGATLPYNGQYDSACASALAQVLGVSVPGACAGGGQPPQPPTPPPPPGPGPSPSPTPGGSTSSSSNTGLIIGAVVAALAVGGAVAYSKRKKGGGKTKRRH